ncbi:MAG: HNH endonuclease [Nitrosopumilaceae archaeon]
MEQARLEFNRFFNKRTLASTYKPYFLKSILELTEFENNSNSPFPGKQWVSKLKDGLKVDLEFIASRFGFYYWDPHFKFRLKQSPNPKEDVHIHDILEDFQERLKGRGQRPKITVFCTLKQSDVRRRIISRCIKPDVLWRLLKDCNIYTISEDKESIVISDSVLEYIRMNKPALQHALNFVIASYLESCNSSPQIATKISEKQPVSNLKSKVFRVIKQIQNQKCFYCNKRPIDVQEHVIPKNYVWETKVFNIVGACKVCNREKWHNRLPKWNIFERVLDRNDEETFSNLILNSEYSKEGYKLTYKNCLQDYAKKEFWEPT